MRKPIQSIYITTDEIRTLLKKTLGIKLARTGIYYYIKAHNFPEPGGGLKPRKWDREAVMAWVDGHKK